MSATRISSPLEFPFSGSLESTVQHQEPVMAIEALRSAWESLGSSNPMRSYHWVRAAVAAFPLEGFRIVTAPNARAFAAFVTRPDSRALVPLGWELYEPAEFPYADAGAAEALAEEIIRLQTAVLIRDMFADSAMVEALARVAGRRVVKVSAPGHPWLKLDDTWLEPQSHLNAGRRSDLRRAQRNAAKFGPVHCEIVTPSSATLAPTLEEVFRVESSGWKGSIGTGLANDPKVGGFYRHFAEAACSAGKLRIGILRIGERTAAMQFAIEQGGCFWLFKMGFDETFARFSPGTLLMVESLRFARQRGCERFEFMGTGAAWNQVWSPRLHEAVSLQLQPPTVRGWVNVIAAHARGTIKNRLLREKSA